MDTSTPVAELYSQPDSGIATRSACQQRMGDDGAAVSRSMVRLGCKSLL
jgi:hypothetical protein